MPRRSTPIRLPRKHWQRAQRSWKGWEAPRRRSQLDQHDVPRLRRPHDQADRASGFSGRLMRCPRAAPAERRIWRCIRGARRGFGWHPSQPVAWQVLEVFSQTASSRSVTRDSNAALRKAADGNRLVAPAPGFPPRCRWRQRAKRSPQKRANVSPSQRREGWGNSG